MMNSPTPEESTSTLFRRINAGDHSAKEELFVLAYDHLRRLAGSHFRGKPANHTLEPTAIVHEAFLRLMRAEGGFQDRSHFLAVASVAMRQILIDHGRRGNAAKRGAGKQVTWDDDESEFAAALDRNIVDILALEKALNKLATLQPRRARIVELRYWGGLTVEEVAELLNVSRQTIEKEWRHARAWLRAMLADEATDDEGDLQWIPTAH